MKNYIKPNMDLLKIELKQNIASASGLSTWLETHDEYYDVGISHYDLVYES